MGSENAFTLTGRNDAFTDEVIIVALEKKFGRSVEKLVRVDSELIEFTLVPVATRSLYMGNQVHSWTISATPGHDGFTIDVERELK